jgi:ATP-dependent RNA helicase DDX54/DBP10
MFVSKQWAKIMDSDEEFDIAGNIALDSASEEDFSSGEEYGEVQDEIVSSDDEEEQEPAPKKKKITQSFPSLEISDDEKDSAMAKEDIEFASYFNNQPQQNKAKGGTFASFGLSKPILNNISKKGFKQPTPIQRKTIPLILQNRDIVGMARTGSGKTAAFSLPLIEKLKMHSAKVGARAIVLSPSRELAIQTYKVIKDFSRGLDLRCVLLIGGDSLEEQFNMMMSNPDIIVATPGRFLHLKIEMRLELKSVEYVVFDEADRLFEMGFEEQLTELIGSLPANRQSLLFSATLPRSLVDFAKAGLTNPVLVRLDAETKISDQLEMCFISTKNNEREANLLNIIQDVIKVPLATQEELKKLDSANKLESDSESDEDKKKKDNKKKNLKRKRLPPANQLPHPQSTIVFVPTRHHVEYITVMLKESGYAVSYIYGTLDQHARKRQLLNFRAGLTPIMVVTDVAARGIDVPVLANVINFSLPASSKIFIHRVGRTARAGNRGWAYSIVSENELPYLLDLELFLGRKIFLTPMHDKKCEIMSQKMGDSYIEPKVNYTDRMILGAAPRYNVENMMEMFNHLLETNYDLKVLQGVAAKAEKLYFRTRQSAGGESVKRAKEIKASGWDEQNLLFGKNLEQEKLAFLEKLQNRRNKETVFEFGKKDDSLVDLMNTRRKQIAPIQRRAKEQKELREKEREAGLFHNLAEEVLKTDDSEVGYSVSDKVLEQEFETAEDVIAKKKKKTFRDPNFFISHYAPTNVIQDQQLSLNSGFVNEAAAATFDLNDDDRVQNHKQTPVMQWDKKKHKYVNSRSTDKKYIIGESGIKMPASYRAGVYDAWKSAHKSQGYKTGVRESSSSDYKSSAHKNGDNRKFKHKKDEAPRAPDKFRDDFHKQKKKVEKALESGKRVKGYNKQGQSSEIKSTEEIRKGRELQEKRRAKNARPSKKKY